MNNDNKTDELQRAPGLPAAKRFPVRDLLQLAITLVLLIGVPWAWKHYLHERVLEGEQWLKATAGIRDPWQRFRALQERSTSLTDEQSERADIMRTIALELALTAQVATAFDFIESPTSLNSRHLRLAELLDQYPRDAKIRLQQLQALVVLWPNISELSTVDRVELLRMATRCHLQEASAPDIPLAQEYGRRDETLACLRHGAQALGTRETLTRLLDTAHLGHALTLTETAHE